MSLAAIVSEISSGKGQITKIDHAIKKVMVTPGSSFDQTMMGRSPQYYIQSFVEIGLPVPEKKIFEGFLPHIWAWRPSWSCDQHHVNKVSFPCTGKLSHKI